MMHNLSAAVRASATATCQAASVPPEWLEDCILDVGLTGASSFADAFAALPAPAAPAPIDAVGGTVPPGSCVATGSMMSPRLGFEARVVTLNNGTVLVAGGLDTSAGHVLAGAEIYDPTTGTFTSAGTMSRPRMRFALVKLGNGNVLAAGGVNDAGAVEASADLYDPVRNAWTPTGSMAVARFDFNGATLPDGRVLVIVGLGGFQTS